MPATDPILPPTNGVIRRSGSTADTVGDTGTVSLDVLAARRARALPPGVRYELKGVAFTLPPVRALPVDLAESAAAGDTAELLRRVLGEDVIGEMAAAGFTLGDFELICEDWRRRNGLAAGTAPLLPAAVRAGGPR
ncbi:hypothetical protein ABZ615_27035 [Streptomyces sp. NPDC007325]|uniref:hypothetical protein n=1 Tax=Streptomyces sp. NPDC007325 TaxID=3154588 RepID=UPI00340D9CBD